MEIYIQKVRENLKQRFKREYLGFLRSSVIKREDKINEDDIVLIGTDDKKRLHWLLGRVLELFPGKDGIIRLVKSRTESGDMLRPIQRLYPLEVTSNHGFLNGYFFCLEYSKKSGRISWLNFYRKRFLRIAPLHMMVYWTYTTLFTYTGSGPLWPTYDTNPVCRKYWWWDLLYINNFLTGWQQCLIVNWYLAVDMQLYMMSPLFVIALLRLTVYYDTIYDKTHTRMSPYFVGLTLGHYLWKRGISKDESSNKMVLWYRWIITAILMWICFCVFYITESTPLRRALYNGLSSTLFSCGIAWIVFACVTERRGPGAEPSWSMPEDVPAANGIRYSESRVYCLAWHSAILSPDHRTEKLILTLP
ncbi:nose resistant to fluoxetine protein 6 [Trichonephila clavipes]|nr:nose resistant to fluoxetine protein 6 [Trichonephila clavipes]